MPVRLENWIPLFKEADLWLSGEGRGEVLNLGADSRGPLTPSFVFFARRGSASDGHQFLPVLARSPEILAFVVEDWPKELKTSAHVIVVRNSTEAMAIAAKNFYRDPTSSCLSIGVTGTNGKTTTTFLVQSLLKHMNYRVVRSGTIETEFEGFRQPSSLTTPDFTELQRIFSEFKQKGATAFVFEASSHALEQKRILGLELDAAIFTNLSPEHLDYHRTMEAYFQAKKKLFSEILSRGSKARKMAILPLDGSYGSRLNDDLKGDSRVDVVTWGFEKSDSASHLQIEKWETSLDGSSLQVSGLGLESVRFQFGLVGRYNIENVAGVLALGAALQASEKTLQAALANLPPVSGRLERIGHRGVFVDYAHTPDALENVLSTLRPLTAGKLKVVFGCGGDRDRTKRAPMGSIAELYADELFVTSDNPRTENPEAIVEEILSGIQKIKPTTVEVDRKKAIEKSLRSLGENDVVLIAGKGHENYQIIGTTKYPFDDREIAASFLNQNVKD